MFIHIVPATAGDLARAEPPRCQQIFGARMTLFLARVSAEEPFSPVRRPLAFTHDAFGGPNDATPEALDLAAARHNGRAPGDELTIALAQPDSDGDALDGDELGLPIVLGVAVVAYVGWMLIRRSSRKSA